MKTQSSKQAKEARWLASIEPLGYCESCGKSGPTDRSHTVTKAQEKDLAMDLDNVIHECRSCHEIWEHGNLKARKNLLTYERKREYMKEKAQRVYELQVTKGRMD